MVTIRIDYTQRQLVEAIRQVGIKTGDVVSLQVSLGRLGMPENVRTIQDISQIVVAAFDEVLGAGGALIVPTYSYSIGRGEVFDVDTTPSAVGEFSEYFRTLPGVVRSRDPMLSTAGRGGKAAAILREVSTSCYGIDSVFDRLRQHGAKICTLGVSLYWATYRHYIEEAAGVPFRFRKRFSGIIREAGILKRESWIYFAAPFLDNCAPNGLPLEKAAAEQGLVRVASVGRGELMAIDAREYFDFGLQQLKEQPWLTAKGPACDLAQMILLEDRRIGITPLRQPTAPMLPSELLRAMTGLRRDPISPGIDAAFVLLQAYEPSLYLHRYASGTNVAGDIVPEKWWCRSATVSRADKTSIHLPGIDSLSVTPYSQAFRGEVSVDELLAHCTISDCEGISSRALVCPETMAWHLTLSKEQLNNVCEGTYLVDIDAVTAFGALQVGEVSIPDNGDGDSYIILIARVDHRSGDLSDLRGAVCGLSLIRELRKRSPLPIGICLLLVASPLALSAWCQENPNKIDQCLWAARLDELLQDNRVQRRNILSLPNMLDDSLGSDGGAARQSDVLHAAPDIDLLAMLRQTIEIVDSEIRTL